MRARFGIVALLVGCRTAAVHDDPGAARIAAPVARPSAAPAIDAGPAVASLPTELHAFAEGACPTMTAYPVGQSAVFVGAREAWTLEANGVRPFLRLPDPAWNAFEGRVLGYEDHIARVGGSDLEHGWALAILGTVRGQDASTVHGVPGKDRPYKTPRGEYGFYAITSVIPQPDGGLWGFGEHSMYLDIPGDEKIPSDRSHDRFFAWDRDGKELDIHLPGEDMSGGDRLASGEIVVAARSKTGKAMLRRWSPTRKVDDLVAKESAATPPELLVGTSRAVLALPKQRLFLGYGGADVLVPSALTGKDARSWLLTTADELWITTGDGRLFIETPGGKVTEEALPEPARLAAEPTTPWLMTDAGSLYVRAGKEWRKVNVAAGGPWSAETHPPGKLEWVRTIGDETFAGVVRTDRGFGARAPGPIRTLYASKDHGAPLRCGAPFSKGALMPFPKAADASCTNRVVVIGTEAAKDPKKAYAKIGAALKGDTALGASLVFVGFGRWERALGILAPSAEIAKELETKLAKVTAHVPETVCGAPDEHSRLVFTTKTGTFTE